MTIGVVLLIIVLLKDQNQKKVRCRNGKHIFNIEDATHHLQRIDKILPEFNSEWSRSQLQEWIKEGLIEVNGKAVKSNYKLKLGDRIEITEKEVVEADIQAENLNLDIYYEDDDVAIVYKPKGMVVHPSPGHYTGTLVNGLMYQIKIYQVLTVKFVQVSCTVSIKILQGY